MAINMVWENEAKTAVRMEFVGRWTWNELGDAIETSAEMLDTVEHDVAFIVDMLQSNGTPPLALTNTRNALRRRHPRAKPVVLISTNDTYTALWKSFTQVYGWLTQSHDYYIVKTLDEARTAIASHADGKS